VKEYYLIGKIVSAYGKEGYVKIFSFSDFPERFSGLKSVYIDFFGDKKSFKLEDAVDKNGTILLRFSNFSSADEVSFLIGRELFVEEADVVKLPEYTYFIHDLIGSMVFEEDKKLGVIKDVLRYPANDIYVIEKIDGSELLLPAVQERIISFDPLKKLMVLMPGSSDYDED
jgi:16S rRNA processing protein RimM